MDKLAANLQHIRDLIFRSNQYLHHVGTSSLSRAIAMMKVRNVLDGTMRPDHHTVGRRGVVSRGIAVNLATSIPWG